MPSVGGLPRHLFPGTSHVIIPVVIKMIIQGQCSIQTQGHLRSVKAILGYFFQEILSTNCETFEQLR